jgi:uncharacterized protein YprB with RNaseH-like and TPR domain
MKKSKKAKEQKAMEEAVLKIARPLMLEVSGLSEEEIDAQIDQAVNGKPYDEPHVYHRAKITVSAHLEFDNEQEALQQLEELTNEIRQIKLEGVGCSVSVENIQECKTDGTVQGSTVTDIYNLFGGGSK